jgi:Fur family transcriptional regulator, ferric uptake regulator
LIVKKPCNCPNNHSGREISSLTSRLRRESRKVTGPRAAILAILRRHPHPLANREIHAELPKGECDLATVYRAMQMLEKLGMVRRFDFGDGSARFELVEEGETKHHHHLICTQCAEVVKVEECIAPEVEQRIAARNGFRAVTHRLEFFGVCPACQK